MACVGLHAVPIEDLTFAMTQNSSTCICLSPEDSIEKLGLTVRPFNALRRASILTIGELTRVIESGHLLDVRNIGQTSAAEIEERLGRVQLVDASELMREPDIPSPDTTLSQAGVQPIRKVEVPTIPIEVIRWQVELVERQVGAGLLHEQARIAGNTIAHWLSVIGIIDSQESYEILAGVLGAAINVCEELSFLFDQIHLTCMHNYVTVLLSRYGFEARTLENIGLELGVTRERIRQIGNNLKGTMGRAISAAFRSQSAHDLGTNPAFLRMQSALLIARDAGMDITYEQWEQSIRVSGLVGRWKPEAFATIDPVEAMIAIFNLLCDNNIRELSMPDNLKCAIQLATSGTPDLPARVVRIREALPKATSKLVKRHARFCGGVHVRWLSQEIGEELTRVKDILQALGCRKLCESWFVPSIDRGNYDIGANDVLHHALRKMFRYCGPLSPDDICSGIRSVASRTNYPVPPPSVMEKVLKTYGYRSEEGLYYWNGENDEELSASEATVMNCLEQRGPVVHHAELAQAFLDSELSFPALHATLTRSPLFERIGAGLYKLRGRSVSRQDIERAESTAESTSVNLEIEYDRRGNIYVSASLGILAVCTGIILSEQLPNLSGEWDCLVGGKRCGKLKAADNQFRHLRKPFEVLGCQTGDRVKFTFNTWNRTVIIDRVDT